MVALESVDDAEALLVELFNAQRQRAEEEKTPMNAPVDGDHHARHLFSTLLPPAVQRAFFLRLATQPKFWPRLRSLVGSPPFDFLKPEDGGILCASGMQRNRTNLAREHEHMGASSSGFGDGHYVDEDYRRYKIIDRGGKISNELPWRDLQGGAMVVADVLIKKRRLATKRAVLSGATKRQVTARSLAFPRPGEELSMNLCRGLETYGGESDSTELRARVTNGRQSFVSSNIARVVLRVL